MLLVAKTDKMAHPFFFYTKAIIILSVFLKYSLRKQTKLCCTFSGVFFKLNENILRITRNA